MPTSHHNHIKDPNQAIFHNDKHLTMQVALVQPLKEETKHSLAHLRVFITYF